jgi:glycine/D-amino acid oxidase-like deaminating enzyme
MTTSCDVLVVGGGILGLWAAKYASGAGLSVVLVDKTACGSGGSNGLLGALLPHLPNATNEKKRFQLEALSDLPGLVAGLEHETGRKTGYRQCGRLMPIRLQGFQKRVDRCAREAPTNWHIGERQYHFERLEEGEYAGWINPELAPLGLAYDDLSARAAPRLMTAALKAALANKVEIIEGFEFGSYDELRGRAVSADGRQTIIAKQLILSAGFETYGLLKLLTGADLGHGVKGHSALFRLEGVADKPILYDNGVYVVPHQDGTVAVGSTSEEAWTDAHAIEDEKCVPFIEKAKALCPPLREAEPVGRWAGVRPRSYAKEPVVGQLAPDCPIFVLTGGFKISFGIAHRLARALVDRLTGKEEFISLPSSYEVSYHLAEAKADNRR